eukprot:2938114-Rhodomonas_salina.2
MSSERPGDRPSQRHSWFLTPKNGDRAKKKKKRRKKERKKKRERKRKHGGWDGAGSGPTAMVLKQVRPIIESFDPPSHFQRIWYLGGAGDRVGGKRREERQQRAEASLHRRRQVQDLQSMMV